jgi:hypothetical protein
MNMGRRGLALLVLAVACGGPSGTVNPNGGDSYGQGPDGTNDGSDGNNTGTGIGGDGDAPGTSGDGDAPSNVCQEFAVNATPTTPDMLIVLDRSQSMEVFGRWDPSVAATRSVTQKFDNAIHFGLMVFPDDAAGADDVCATGAVKVPVGANQAQAIGAVLDQTLPDGGTPTSSSLDEAYKQLHADEAPNPDAPPTSKFVLLVTDGQPTCPNGNGLRDASPEELAADRALTVTAIDKLKAAGINTYVIGYQTTDFQQAMDEFASHGGTDKAFAVENQDTLTQAFEQISGTVVSCSYKLDKAPEDPSYVQVKLDDKQVNLNDANGWTIKDRTVTIQGSACKTLQDGKDHQLSVQVLCSVVSPL